MRTDVTLDTLLGACERAALGLADARDALARIVRFAGASVCAAATRQLPGPVLKISRLLWWLLTFQLPRHLACWIAVRRRKAPPTREAEPVPVCVPNDANPEV